MLRKRFQCEVWGKSVIKKKNIFDMEKTLDGVLDVMFGASAIVIATISANEIYNGRKYLNTTDKLLLATATTMLGATGFKLIVTGVRNLI